MSVALKCEGSWTIGLPEPVGATSDVLNRLQDRATEPGSVFIGFDFPIGLPADYAWRTGFKDFFDALRQFGTGDWKNWFEVAENKNEISVWRPFYPARPGGTKKEHLIRGLSLASGDQILRACERKTPKRKAACSLFWTLGGNQVGKGAIAGWTELLKPNLDRIAIWPFDGALQDLLVAENFVIAETYPGDVYGQIGIPRTPAWSKRSKAGRASVAPQLLFWLNERRHSVATGLETLIADGFEDGPEGEDQFDATVGLFGMLDVVESYREAGCPDAPDIRRWEGWILGQLDR